MPGEEQLPDPFAANGCRLTEGPDGVPHMVSLVLVPQDGFTSTGTMPTTTVSAWVCSRCGHTWVGKAQHQGRGSEPKVCPKCASPYWDVPRKRKSGVVSEPVENPSVRSLAILTGEGD